MDEGLRVRAIRGSTKHFIREDGIKLTLRKNGTYRYSTGSTHKRSGYVIHGFNNLQVACHILVAEAFLENPEGKSLVDHIDNISSHNSVNNLRWATPAENVNYYHTEQKLRSDNDKAVDITLELNEKVTEIARLRAALKAAEQASEKLKLAGIKAYTGAALNSSEKLLLGVGTEITINGDLYLSIAAASTWILESEKAIGVPRNFETIRRELRNFTQGKRSQWLMYDRYTIGY